MKIVKLISISLEFDDGKIERFHFRGWKNFISWINLQNFL
jgi:hypothetical protein